LRRAAEELHVLLWASGQRHVWRHAACHRGVCLCFPHCRRPLLTLSVLAHTLNPQEMVNSFNNRPHDHVMLISTKAGGLGLNIPAASRVVLVDAGWNPAHEVSLRAHAHVCTPFKCLTGASDGRQLAALTPICVCDTCGADASSSPSLQDGAKESGVCVPAHCRGYHGEFRL
jgi:hypothetical protein